MIRTLLSVFAVGCGNVSVSTPKQIPDTEEEKRIIDSPDGGGKLPMKEAVKKLKAPTPESEDQLRPRPATSQCRQLATIKAITDQLMQSAGC